MGANTAIEWADHTFNPWIGCTKVSPGCDHCYAERDMSNRLHVVQWGAGQPRKRTSEANWRMPLRWNAQAEREGRRFRVFCASLADVFDNEVKASWRADLFSLIRDTPNLDWLLLTKRIGNAPAMLDDALAQITFRGLGSPRWPWANVWLGATIVNQAEADRDIPKLLAVPAATRFLSMEPLLGPVEISPFLRGKHEAVDTICQNCPRDADCECGYHTRKEMKMPAIDWVIVGGESGPHARPMHPAWARSLRDHCNAAGVAFHFKQWGEWAPPSKIEDLRHLGDMMRAGKAVHVYGEGRQPDGHFRRGDDHLLHVGKKAAGRLLDGRTWDELPA